MLTVKHISLSGCEAIYPAFTVEALPDCDTPNVIRDQRPKRLLIRNADYSELTQLTGGTVFVMNEAGRTVARYDLGASMVPLGQESAPAR